MHTVAVQVFGERGRLLQSLKDRQAWYPIVGIKIKSVTLWWVIVAPLVFSSGLSVGVLFQEKGNCRANSLQTGRRGGFHFNIAIHHILQK